MSKKILLDELIKKFEVIPACWYYSELITRKEMVVPFVNGLAELGIRIRGFTWWCYVDGTTSECPHGLGGPWNAYGQGWFSELGHWDNIQLAELESVEETNRRYVDYYMNIFPRMQTYLSCVVPAIDIDVPESWQNVYIRHRPWHSPPLLNNEVGPFDA